MGFYRALSGGSNRHDYSENEQVVGTWVDGRKIYERTFIVNNVTMQYGFTWFTIDLSDSDDIISSEFNGYATSDIYTYCGLPAAFNRNTKSFGIMNNFTGALGTVNAYITVRYVKSV